MLNGGASGVPQPLWWERDGDAVRCRLCPHECRLAPGKAGICGVRTGRPSGLSLTGYGMVSAEGLDPIEKKPLYHFHPGETVWSVGFTGCNLRCPFCQNHRIAEAPPEYGRFTPPSTVVSNALDSGAGMIAYTYSEPTVHLEYLLECADTARRSGLLNVLVTNGHINAEPAENLLEVMDGVNVDLKSWSGDYYRKILGGSLDTVKDFVRIGAARSWIEITTLIVPGDNDVEADMESMSKWISTVSPVIPLHLSAYHPAHRYDRPGTTERTMTDLARVAGTNLSFVYIGNLGVENDTACPECGEAVVRRRYYQTEVRLTAGACPRCGRAIPGVFR